MPSRALSIAAYDSHVEQLFDIVIRVATALRQVGIDYRIVGGVAAFIHVSEKDFIAARITRDVDVAIHRRDLAATVAALQRFGFACGHASGEPILADATQPKARSAVHLVFVREKVRPDYPEPVPDFSTPVETEEGVLVAPVADLVRMKLTSFREKDRVHVRDMDSVGLITAAVESQLSDLLRERLAVVRATE